MVFRTPVHGNRAVLCGIFRFFHLKMIEIKPR